MLNSKSVSNKDIGDKNMQMLIIKEKHDKLEAHLNA